MARWQEMDAYLKAMGIKVGTATLGQTTGGTHTKGSYHYQGLARDFGVYNCDCPAIAAALKPLAQGTNHVIVELIWTPSPLSRSSGPGTYYKHGGAYVPATKLANGHKDHVHAAIRPGAPHWSQWPGARTPAPKPQPVPVPIPPEEDMSIKDTMFVRGDKSAEVYLIGDGPPRLIKSQSALANQSHLGFGRAPIAADIRTEINNGVKVAVLDQGAMNELL